MPFYFDKLSPEEKTFNMYYHTALRNAGLFLSIALATLSIARVSNRTGAMFTRLFTTVVILISLMFFLVSLYICYVLIQDTNYHEKTMRKAYNLYTIPYIIFNVNLLLILICIATLLKSITHLTFRRDLESSLAF